MYLIVGLVFSRLGFWSGNLFLIAPFPDLCLLVPFYRIRFREFRFFRIADLTDKKDALIIYGGSEIARLEKSLPDPEDPRRKLDGYQKLRVKRNAHFIPKKNKHYARYIFLKTRPEAREGWAVCASTAQEIRVRTAHVHTILCSVRIVNFRPVRTVYAVKIAVQNIFRFYVYPDTISLKLSNSDNFAFDICLFRFLSIVFIF